MPLALQAVGPLLRGASERQRGSLDLRAWRRVERGSADSLRQAHPSRRWCAAKGRDNATSNGRAGVIAGRVETSFDLARAQGTLS